MYSGGKVTYRGVTSRLFLGCAQGICGITGGWGEDVDAADFRWTSNSCYLFITSRDTGTWLSECGAWWVGQGLMERLREATPSGGWTATPSCQGHTDSHQISDSWCPLILLLLLLAFLWTDSQGDGWRICSWILKFLSECLCSVSCLTQTQPDSRPASSHWFRRFAVYHGISKLQPFWAEVMRTEQREVYMSERVEKANLENKQLLTVKLGRKMLHVS